MLIKRISAVLSAITLFAALSLTAEANSFQYAGTVTAATGAFATLTPVGTPVGGNIDVAAAAVAAGLAGPADITDIGVAVGGFCFAFGAGTCAGSIVPITSIDPGTAMTFAAGFSTGGFLNVTAFSPTFMVSIPIMFDLNNGTFAASSAGLGTVSGTGNIVPIPAAAWLFGSALLGLFGLRRRG